MAYFTEANVAFHIGGIDTTTFTSANIAIAGAIADTIVDSINSSAAAAHKAIAADLIAAELMKDGRVGLELKGLSTDSGHIGSSNKSGTYGITIPRLALKVLSPRKRPVFKTTTPDIDGTW